MSEIKIYPLGESFEYEAGKSLLEILLEKDYFVDNPCNGKGVCGKCRVNIRKGEVSAPCETEKKLLSEAELDEGIRLSCLVKPTDDLEIELLQKVRKHKVLTSGYLPEFELDKKEQYGVAIDIGTTTVVCALVDMSTGKEIANASQINEQKHFGLDVLTRITYEIEHGQDGVEKLQKAIVDSLNEMIGEMCECAQISRSEIKEITVAANCTMLHMLLGVDATSLGRAPYKPVFVEAKEVQAKEIGILAAEDAVLYCLPSVSAYIGADIVAGAYVCDLQNQKGNVLFVDIGTNGEIVLSKDGQLLCCSCAAGPALEGMNITCGMRAAEGAIEDVRITENGVEVKVIGETAPAGLCGSGILAAIKELLRVGLVRKEGAFIKKEKLAETDYRYDLLRLNGKKREFVLGEELIITQGDVRQVQLAKGAILSGFTALLEKAGLQMEELDKVLIAGQFGAHLPVESLTGLGILPMEVKDKIAYVGNSSKTGAYMALMSQRERLGMEELAGHMEYMELAETKGYERLFAECLIFPERT